MIVAMANNRVIGLDNEIPWYLSNDLKHFKAITMGKPIIMGRKTFESIGKPLPGRTNIVITRNGAYNNDGIIAVNSIEKALDLACTIADIDGADEVMVVGGAQIYRELLSRCNRLYLTQVYANFEGDTFFPEISMDNWADISREDFPIEGNNPYNYSFVVLERK